MDAEVDEEGEEDMGEGDSDDNEMIYEVLQSSSGLGLVRGKELGL